MAFETSDVTGESSPGIEASHGIPDAITSDAINSDASTSDSSTSDSSAQDVCRAPEASAFPKYPTSWYLFGRSSEIRNGPFSKDFLGTRLVAYRTSVGAVTVMDARCSHLGSDLGMGCVKGDNIQCPFHDWEYAPNGKCVNIPAQPSIPGFASQRVYPCVERHGLIFVFNAPTPTFPLPFFDGVEIDELVPARAFGTILNCPWYMAGANAFDLQHFRAAHDRRLKETPSAFRPHPYAFASSGVFAVEGDSIRDRLTRRFAGEQVILSLTDWCGSLSFATAKFRRTQSFGMVAREPLPDGHVHVQVIVFVKHSRTAIGRTVFDPLRLAIRRYFIKKFLTEDAYRLQGVRYSPHAFIQADREMVSYFEFLTEVAAGQDLNSDEPECDGRETDSQDELRQAPGHKE